MKKTYPQKSLSLIVQLVIFMLFIVPAAAQEQYFTDETDSRIPQIPAICNNADAADIDNDGDWDIIGNAWDAISPYYQYYLYINDGNGFFTEEHQMRFPDTSFETGSVGFADIDNDKDYDAYIVSFNYQDLIYINDGFGFFTDETPERLPPLDCINIEFVLGDFSGDSFCDIITICFFTTGLNHYLLNDGFGYFDDITDLRMPVDTTFDVFGKAADLDNDLDLDLLLTWTSGSSELHIRGLENIDGYFTHFEEGRMDDRFTRWIDTADIDNDGDLDIVISGIISMGILINQEGLFVDESEERLPDYNIYWGGCSMIGLGDYDNDGDIDIYAGFSVDEKDHLFVNDGQGYFELADERIPDTEASTNWPEPFDADSDGDLDLFLGCSGDGQQRILINHSTPDTIPPVIIAEDLPLGDVDSLTEYQVKISAYDNISVEKGALSVVIHYSINAGDFITDDLVPCGGTIFSCFIPGQESGTVIDYYIKVEDKMGNYITSPANAPDSLHSFNILPPSNINDEYASSDETCLHISPNPSNSGFAVSYFVEHEKRLAIAVYDLNGRKVHSENLNKQSLSGWQKWYWDGWANLASGIYFIELNKANRREVRKAVLIR